MKYKHLDLNFVEEVVDYFNNTENTTVRKTAEHFNISKTRVHRYLTVVMPNSESRKKLDYNKSIRCVRGGQALAMKFKSKNKMEV